MQHRFVAKDDNNRRLILIYAGWGMDYRPFAHLRKDGYDILVVWDYRDLGMDMDILSGYVEICLVAWSFGVYAASLSMYRLGGRLTGSIAVNGTLYPVDDLRGIPRAIFNATLDSMDRRNLLKFYRRMCGGSEAFARFAEVLPERPVEELVEELRAVASLDGVPCTSWDVVIIGENDAIFPCINQQRAWSGYAIEMKPWPHLPDFQTVIDRYIVDKNLVAMRFRSSVGSYDDEAFAQRRAAAGLWDELRRKGLDALLRHGNIIEIGCGTGMLTGLYAGTLLDSRLELWDIADCGMDIPPGAVFRKCDAEIGIGSIVSGSVDCILSSSSVQWFNSLPRFIKECHRVLAPGGVLALSSFSEGNLPQVAEACGLSLSLPTESGWREMVPEGMEIVSLYEFEVEKTFPTPYDVLRHLKLTGVNAISRQKNARVAVRDFVWKYPRDVDGMCLLTYKPIIVILKKTDDER